MTISLSNLRIGRQITVVLGGTALLLAGLSALVFRPGAAKKALVRGWRCCGYLYQIPRSLTGRV